jgi:hypothetical protein
LKDYYFEELGGAERKQVEGHLAGCAGCREELHRLRLASTTLLSLREEEIPRRIAFVSDPVIEPAPWRRWLAGVWNTPARLGFASAALLSVALVVFSVTRPTPPVSIVRVPAPAPAAQTASNAAAAPATPVVSAAEVQARIDRAANAAADRAVAARTADLKAELAADRQKLLLVAAELEFSNRRESARTVATLQYGPPQQAPVEAK